jgi:hypothetical protein
MTPNPEGLMCEYRYALSNPDDVEVAGGEVQASAPAPYVAPGRPAPAPVGPASDPLALLKQAKSLVAEIGVGQLRPVLAKLDELNCLSKAAGGVERLSELLDLLA